MLSKCQTSWKGNGYVGWSSSPWGSGYFSGLDPPSGSNFGTNVARASGTIAVQGSNGVNVYGGSGSTSTLIHTLSCGSMDLSDDGSRVSCVGTSGLGVWGAQSGSQVGSYIEPGSSGSTALNQDGSIMAIVTNATPIKIYQYNNGSWTQLGGSLEGSGLGASLNGGAIDLSDDGYTVAIGSYLDDGNGTDSGSVKIFDWNGTAWVNHILRYFL